MATTSMGRTPEEQAEFDEQQEFSNGFTVAETSGQLFERLTPSSTVGEISAAYNEFQQNNGGNSAANRDVAKLFLNSLGIPSSTIEQGLSAFSGARPGRMTSAEAQENIYKELQRQSKSLGTEKRFQTGAAGSKEGGLGSTDAVMRDMAKKLADAGLTSIEQFGQGKVPVIEQVAAIPEYVNGTTLLGYSEFGPEYNQVPSGRWLYEVTENVGENPTTSRRYIDDAEVARLGLSGTEPKVVDLKTGERDGFINKDTGEPLTSLTGYDGRGWSGTSAGDGQTIYNVKFDESTGLPMFFNQQKHGKDDYADFLKVLAIGAAIFAPQIGAALLPAGSSAAAALAVGSAVSGLIGSGGDIKSAIKAGLASYLGGQAGSWASRTANSALVGTIATNMTRAAILGGDMEQALVASLVQAAPAEIIKQFPNFAQLPRAAQEAAVAATVDLMRTGGENLDQIALQGATKGATDYALSNIEGYKDLRPAQQEIVRTRVSNVLNGESLSDELLQGAIAFGNEAVQYQVNDEKAKKDGWADYETQQAAKTLYGDKVTPDLYADKQNTTEDEAKEIARTILGREPTEFEYMQLVGLSEGDAAQNSDLAAIRYDESTFDSNELAEAYRAVYGKEPTAEWLASDEAMDMLGRSDAQGKNILQNYYIQDKNTTTGSEAQEMWEAMGNTGPIPEDVLFNMLSMSQPGATAYAQRYTDAASVTFDGSGYETSAQARAAAISAGYNSFTDPITGKTQVILPEDESLKRSNLIQQVLQAQGVNPATATAEQRQQAITLVGSIAQDKLDSTNVVDLMADAGIAGGSYVKPVVSTPRNVLAFDGSGFNDPVKAADAARAAGYKTFSMGDGKTYKILTPVQEGEVKDSISNAATFGDAFAEAREKLGAGKTFEYKGKLYTTDYAATNKAVPFDGSGAATKEDAAKLAVANGKLSFTHDGKTYGLDMQTAAIIANSQNQSEAETNRLLRQAIKPATNESLAETQRLMESGTRGTMDVVNSMVAQTLGTSQRGLGQLVENIGNTYAQITGDTSYNNAMTRAGQEIQEYAKGRDIYGLDVQKDRVEQAFQRSIDSPNFFDKVSIIGSAMANNPLGSFDIVGSEFIEEVPETVAQIAVAIFTGGGSLAVSTGRKIIGGLSLAGSFVESFGASGKEAYLLSKARNDSDEVALNKAYLNATLGFLAEIPGDFLADKALVAPFMKNFAEKTFSSIGAGVITNTTAGAASELFSGTLQNFATQMVVDPNTASWNKAVSNGVFEMFIGSAVQTASATPGSVVDTAQVIGRDYFGQDVTIQQVLDGDAGLDLSTVASDIVFAQTASGDTITVGGAMLAGESLGLDYADTVNLLPDNLTGVNDVVAFDDDGSPVTLGELLDARTQGGVTDTYADYLNTLLSTPSDIDTIVGTGAVTDTTGTTTGTVLSVDANAGTALVADGAGNVEVVDNTDGSLTVGDVIADTGSDAAAGGDTVVDTGAATGTDGTVLSVDNDSGTALVVNDTGNTTVVDNTDGSLVVGDTITPTPTPTFTPTAQTPTLTPTPSSGIDSIERILIDQYGWIDNGDGTLTTTFGQKYDRSQGGILADDVAVTTPTTTTPTTTTPATTTTTTTPATTTPTTTTPTTTTPTTTTPATTTPTTTTPTTTTTTPTTSTPTTTTPTTTTPATTTTTTPTTTTPTTTTTTPATTTPTTTPTTTTPTTTPTTTTPTTTTPTTTTPTTTTPTTGIDPVEQILIDKYGWTNNGDGTLTTKYGQIYDNSQGGILTPATKTPTKTPTTTTPTPTTTPATTPTTTTPTTTTPTTTTPTTTTPTTTTPTTTTTTPTTTTPTTTTPTTTTPTPTTPTTTTPTTTTPTTTTPTTTTPTTTTPTTTTPTTPTPTTPTPTTPTPTTPTPTTPTPTTPTPTTPTPTTPTTPTPTTPTPTTPTPTTPTTPTPTTPTPTTPTTPTPTTPTTPTPTTPTPTTPTPTTPTPTTPTPTTPTPTTPTPTTPTPTTPTPTTPTPPAPAPAPTPVPAPAPTPVPTPTPEPPPKEGVKTPASQELIEALYSTMDYYDPFDDPFAQTTMRSASTKAPTNQTKMAQGGYLDDLLAENISVDDLLKLLR